MAKKAKSTKRAKAHRGGLTPDQYLDDNQLRKLRRHVREKADYDRLREKDKSGPTRPKGYALRPVVNELLVELLAGSGLRASELCALNIEDLPQAHKKSCLWVRDGKGNVSRTVEIGANLKKLIGQFCRKYRKGAAPNEPMLVNEQAAKKIREAADKGKTIKVKSDDMRLAYRSVWTKIKRIGVKAGIGDLHPHMLRHTFLTRLYNVDKDLLNVQDQAGHASPTTTAIYAKTNNKARKRQVAALDAEDF